MGVPWIETVHRPERELKMKLVPPSELDSLWEEAVMLLSRDENTMSYYDFTDMYVGVSKGYMQLWLFGDENAYIAAMVTELRQFPQDTIFHILHAGAVPATNALELLTFNELIEKWALAQGATISRIPCAREGWERKLSGLGYRKSGIVLDKKLEPLKEH